MRLTDRLNAEHEVFLVQLETLAGMVERGEPAAALRAVALAIGAALERHRDVEDRELFPAILRVYGSGFPPIQVMQAEHREIQQCLEGIASGDDRTVVLVRRLIDVLSQHIAKETQVLFPMAEQRISVAELEHMASGKGA